MASKPLLAALALVLLGLAAVPAASAEPVPLPCSVSPPSHVGASCTVGPVECSFYIWVDLNPPNPTLSCP